MARGGQHSVTKAKLKLQLQRTDADCGCTADGAYGSTYRAPYCFSWSLEGLVTSQEEKASRLQERQLPHAMSKAATTRSPGLMCVTCVRVWVTAA